MENITLSHFYSIQEVIKITGLGRTSIYKAIKSGGLVAKKFGHRTLISAEALSAWAESLPNLNHIQMKEINHDS